MAAKRETMKVIATVVLTVQHNEDEKVLKKNVAAQVEAALRGSAVGRNSIVTHVRVRDVDLP